MPIDMVHGSDISLTGNIIKGYPVEPRQDKYGWSFPVNVETAEGEKVRVNVESKFEPKQLLDILKDANAISLKGYFNGYKKHDGTFWHSVTTKSDSIIPIAANKEPAISATVDGQIVDISELEKGSIVLLSFRRKNYKDNSVSWKYGTVVVSHDTLGDQSLEVGKFMRVQASSLSVAMADDGPMAKFTPYVTADTVIVGPTEKTLNA